MVDNIGVNNNSKRRRQDLDTSSTASSTSLLSADEVHTLLDKVNEDKSALLKWLSNEKTTDG